jgi:CheY-like chemotaxis protein
VSGRKKRILFVEDEMDIRFFISTVLKAEGYEAVPARNALEGLEKARAQAPDLVISDVMMPQAGGVTFFQELRRDEHLRHIPIVMLTGVSRKAFDHHLRMITVYQGQPLAPPEAYIEKPLDPDTLLRTIRALLHEDAAPTTR